MTWNTTCNRVQITLKRIEEVCLSNAFYCIGYDWEWWKSNRFLHTVDNLFHSWWAFTKEKNELPGLFLVPSNRNILGNHDAKNGTVHDNWKCNTNINKKMILLFILLSRCTIPLFFFYLPFASSLKAIRLDVNLKTNTYTKQSNWTFHQTLVKYHRKQNYWRAHVLIIKDLVMLLVRCKF